MRLALLVLVRLLAPVAAAAAGVVVIDPANGPGTDFTSLNDDLISAAGAESLIAYVQPLSLDPQGHKVLGVPSAMLMLDGSF